jgi:hypothetical protein
MVLPHRTLTNKDNIRNAIINRIKKLSAYKRKHPHHQYVSAKFLYLKEPVGKGSFKIDRIDSSHPYHEGANYNLSWSIVTNKELMDIYNQVKKGETYCFYLKDDLISKQTWVEDKKQIDTL